MGIENFSSRDQSGSSKTKKHRETDRVLGDYQNQLDKLGHRLSQLEADEGPSIAGKGARVYSSIDVSIPNNTWTSITYDTERYDTDTLFEIANPTRLRATTAGKYVIVGNVEFAENTAGRRKLRILRNNMDIIAHSIDIGPPNVPFALNIATIWDMAANDWVELQAHQTTGGDLDVVATVKYSPEFMVQRIG